MMGLSNEQRIAVYDAVSRIEYNAEDKETQEACDTILSVCGVPDHVAQCQTHVWRERESESTSRYQDGFVRTFECIDCGVEKEEVYTLQTRVVDGSEVRI